MVQTYRENNSPSVPPNKDSSEWSHTLVILINFIEAMSTTHKLWEQQLEESQIEYHPQRTFIIIVSSNWQFVARQPWHSTLILYIYTVKYGCICINFTQCCPKTINKAFPFGNWSKITFCKKCRSGDSTDFFDMFVCINFFAHASL